MYDSEPDKARDSEIIIDMRYKCIIFDCDGVLVDSEAISSKVLVEMAKSVGLKLELDFTIERFSGVSLKDTLKYIEDRIERSLPSNFEKEYRKNTYSAFKRELQPIPGIHNLLDRIKIPYCVASSGPVEKIRLNLTTVDLIEKFENHIFSSFEIGSWKPDPGIFLFAAEKMGFQPNECVVIEDSISGVKAAKAGGFDVFIYVNNRNLKEVELKDKNVFNNMNDLDSLLE